MKEKIFQTRYEYFENGDKIAQDLVESGVNYLINKIDKFGFRVIGNPFSFGGNHTIFFDPSYGDVSSNAGEITTEYIAIWKENIDPKKLNKLEAFLENCDFPELCKNLKGGEK